MYDKPLTVEQMLAMLAEAPARIADLTTGLSPNQLIAPPEPGEWSARDVLAHLRACSDVWGRYIALILHEEKPTFKAVNPTTWIKQTDYHELEFQVSLKAYTDQRLGLLAVLKPLSPEDWRRTATVTGAGKAARKIATLPILAISCILLFICPPFATVVIHFYYKAISS